MIFYHPDDMVRFIKCNETHIIGFTSGCFDLIHPLHVEYLNKCRRECGELYVFIDSDRLVNEHKNKTPLINERDRAYMIDNLQCVKGVMIFDSPVEMNSVILQTGKEFAGIVRVFKHNYTVYNSKLYEYNLPNVKNRIIPDIVRFESTTQITEFLKQTK